MISIDETREMLEELAAELPEPFFRELNGGISLLPEAKLSPIARAEDLYIMGEYCRSRALGRYIVIYYGSFMKLYGHLDRERLLPKLRETLRHEFRHHLESLAGEKGLELEDERQAREYLEARPRQGAYRRK